ncbi:MAG: PilZ domain-containing protein [Desulfuromonadales bacterium]|nr:PilZ domain-containing protein [Desulfuromonadales bacterium]
MSETPKIGDVDQRARLRAPLLVLKVRLEDGGKVFFGYARNISRSGMFIATTNPREPGSQFQVELTLPPTGQRLQCSCEVVWKREFSLKSAYEPGMGLKFLDLPPAAAIALDDWIKVQVGNPEMD